MGGVGGQEPDSVESMLVEENLCLTGARCRVAQPPELILA